MGIMFGRSSISLSSQYPQIQLADAKKFLTNYTLAFKKLLDTKYSSEKAAFPLYAAWPFEIRAYITSKGLVISYVRNAKSFSVHVENAPKSPMSSDHWSWAISNRYFCVLSEDPEKSAEQDIKYQLDIPKMHEAVLEQEAELAEAQWEEHVKGEVEYYLKYLDKSDAVKIVSVEKNLQDLYTIIDLFQGLRNRFELYTKLGATAQELVHSQITDEVDISLFLVIHGKYGEAIACLRRVMEIGLRAILMDFMALRDKTWEKTRDDWVDGADGRGQRPGHFTGDESVLSMLLDKRTEEVLTQYCAQYLHFTSISTYEFLKETYRRLSSFVHLEPISTAELLLEFAEYDQQRFNQWEDELFNVCRFLDLFLIVKFPKALDFRSDLPSFGFPVFSEAQIAHLKSL
jgi:hypothetical protein